TRTRPVQISSTLLHPFPVDDAPNIGDMTAFGRFEGLTDTSLQGSGVMMFNSLDDRGAYPGSFGFIPDDPNRHAAFSWPIRATTAADGQFLMIGQGKSGSMTYVGTVITQNGSPSELWGIARLSFLNGRVLYNAYNCSFTPLIQ
ncbi:MAG TPA: hypothetical protein VFT74_19560, partial [Isosphaeraceae bacterium]|nr:hypothetical protein [Isosphaeraceae bacterium]